MATETLDARGLKCPQPTLKLSIFSRKVSQGSLVEVLADCPEFPNDVKKWCTSNHKVLLACNDTGGGMYKAEIQF